MIYAKLLKYGALTLGGVGAAGTYASLRTNQYNLDSIGVVRFGRASSTVSVIVPFIDFTTFKNCLL